MNNAIWVQHEDETVKSSYLFLEEELLTESYGKKAYEVEQIILKAQFRNISVSENSDIKEIGVDNEGYFISCQLEDEETGGRKMAFSGYGKGDIEAVLDYFNRNLKKISKTISTDVQNEVRQRIKSEKQTKVLLKVGVAATIAAGVILIYYINGKS